MQPARISGAKAVLGQPKDWNVERDGPVTGLPVRRETVGRTPCVVSAWTPTPEEVIDLVFGGSVELVFPGGVHPVTIVRVGPRAEPLP